MAPSSASVAALAFASRCACVSEPPFAFMYLGRSVQHGCSRKRADLALSRRKYIHRHAPKSEKAQRAPPHSRLLASHGRDHLLNVRWVRVGAAVAVRDPRHAAAAASELLLLVDLPPVVLKQRARAAFGVLEVRGRLGLGCRALGRRLLLLVPLSSPLDRRGLLRRQRRLRQQEAARGDIVGCVALGAPARMRTRERACMRGREENSPAAARPVTRVRGLESLGLQPFELLLPELVLDEATPGDGRPPWQGRVESRQTEAVGVRHGSVPGENFTIAKGADGTEDFENKTRKNRPVRRANARVRARARLQSPTHRATRQGSSPNT